MNIHIFALWVSKKKTDAFHIEISRKLIAGICLFPRVQATWGCWWLQKYSSIQNSTIKMHFNSHMGLDLCFKLINCSLIYASFTNKIFGQLLSNYSRYAASFNMKAVSFFLLALYSVYKKNFTLWNLNYLQAIVLIWQLWMLRINDPQKHGNYMTLLLISNVYKTFCFCGSLIWSNQNCQVNTIACR